MSADSPTNDPNVQRARASAGQRLITAEDLQTHPDPSVPVVSSEPVPSGLLTDFLDVRQSSPALKLRLLLRCYDMAARSRPARKVAGCVLTVAMVLLGPVVYQMVFGLLIHHNKFEEVYPWAFMCGFVVAENGVVFGLILCWFLFGRRRKPVRGEGVHEQIAAIVSDHPDAVREWGGAWVLGNPSLVAEILRLEERREGAADGPHPKPS